MQGQIIGVFVDGAEMPLDRNMIDQDEFDVVTSRGNRYRVVRNHGAVVSHVWDVSLVGESGVQVNETVGRITGVRSLFARNPTSFSYQSTHNALDGGFQNDFLNAVQSLTD